MAKASDSDNSSSAEEYHPVVIVGGGIGGLVLALCLDQVYNHNNKDDNNNKLIRLPIHVYESTSAYTDNAGGAIGLYPNGLRVLRNLKDTAPNLLSQVRNAGCDYVYRRWMRHDGLEVAVAREDELLPDVVEIKKVGDDDDGGEEEGERSGEDCSTEKETNVLTTTTSATDINTTQEDDKGGQRANRRPRGGSFRIVGESLRKISEVSNRISGISLTSTESSTTTTTTTATTVVESELQSLGIRRWKYQQVLYEACEQAGIVIHFGKRLQTVTTTTNQLNDDDDVSHAKTMLHFKDGSKVMTSLLIGADGINSKVRNYVVHPSPTTTTATTTETTANQQQQQQSLEEFLPNYTGVTCLMGCANVPRIRGICFPSSATTKCHACYYPTKVPKEEDIIDTNNEEKSTDNKKYADNNNYEQVFQIYFPSPIERPDTWRTLTPDEAKTECKELAKKLREDGWDEQFLAPLESSTLTGVLRVGLRSREALDVWHVGDDAADNDDEEEVCSGTSVGRAVLLGDSSHPPVPYIGQGAMMAMEDAGTLSLLLAHFCPINGDSESTIDLSKFQTAMQVYENLRVPRTKAVLGSSVQLGKTQQKRADSKLYNAWREVSIKAQVWAYGTLPVMKPGAAFDYRAKVAEALEELHTV